MDEPVAVVVVDSHLAHLDRPFEYAVPADLADRARPGVRVRVRFAGRQVDGFVVERRAEAEHAGRLAPLLKVVSDEVVLTPHLVALCRDLADHYGGTFADVLRLAVPPRHARAERSVPADSPEPPAPTSRASLSGGPAPGDAPRGWQPYPAGAALIRRLEAGESPAAAWLAAPDAGSPEGWPAALATAVAAVHVSGRGSVVVLPDHRDIERVATALDDVLGPDSYVRLTADLGPEQRYRAWVRVLRGHVRVVLGSRSAAFAPVRDLGLVVWWDDGDDNLQEPRAPYPHVREVLRRRAALCGAALLVGGYTRTVQVQQWVQRGELPDVRADSVAALAPRVTVAGEGHLAARDAAAAVARMPSVAWRAVKDGLLRGPVLVQVPRRGYLAGLSCEHCRTAVRCAACAGPLRVTAAGGSATCAWCGRPDAGRACRECGGTTRRSRVVGEERTAEEVGRSFPGSRVVVSRAGNVLASVPARPAVVVATTGAEPVAEEGYAATLLLDGWALLDRGGLDAGVEALRRWSAAAALTRPGGPVVLVGVPPHAGLPPVEALVRWDPTWLARRELEERVSLGLPPARRTATVTGEPGAVAGAAEALTTGPHGPRLEVLGPLPVSAGAGEEERAHRLVIREATGRGGLSAAGVLPRALQDLRAARSLRKTPGELVVQLDPLDLDL
ncbi:primosome assembly protein PriA [Ornithinimicrobium sp. F0845]|uniref:primosomal protein N' family DNA-binding protein n=1 Tax=Ornithinimicrobium sp. F0845 TaxID=2926412 RepID=UPI001FF2C3A8|nr:primosome assembly protein PriA [Ornithinimicrobium sp. F0845]